MLYKDPGNITPRKFVKVNISARDDAALIPITLLSPKNIE
jgi:hypothetical protein